MVTTLFKEKLSVGNFRVTIKTLYYTLYRLVAVVTIVLINCKTCRYYHNKKKGSKNRIRERTRRREEKIRNEDESKRIFRFPS